MHLLLIALRFPGHPIRGLVALLAGKLSSTAQVRTKEE
jgi:hypothetical protein